jgi:hypothetical protein
MRHLLYGIAAAAMMGGALGLALLPRLTTNWLWFLLLGGLCSAAGGGGWVLAGATAGDWPRPRAGWVLMIGGLAGVLISLADPHPLALLWAAAEALGGALLIFPLIRARQRPPAGRPGPVQPPVSRRQAGR